MTRQPYEGATPEQLAHPYVRELLAAHNMFRQEMVRILNAEHDQIAELIDNFSAAIQELSTIDSEILHNDLRRLADALQAHLAYEETHVCPLLVHFSR